MAECPEIDRVGVTDRGCGDILNDRDIVQVPLIRIGLGSEGQGVRPGPGEGEALVRPAIRRPGPARQADLRRAVDRSLEQSIGIGVGARGIVDVEAGRVGRAGDGRQGLADPRQSLRVIIAKLEIGAAGVRATRIVDDLVVAARIDGVAGVGGPTERIGGAAVIEREVAVLHQVCSGDRGGRVVVDRSGDRDVGCAEGRRTQVVDAGAITGQRNRCGPGDGAGRRGGEADVQRSRVSAGTGTGNFKVRSVVVGPMNRRKRQRAGIQVIAVVERDVRIRRRRRAVRIAVVVVADESDNVILLTGGQRDRRYAVKSVAVGLRVGQRNDCRGEQVPRHVVETHGLAACEVRLHVEPKRADREIGIGREHHAEVHGPVGTVIRRGRDRRCECHGTGASGPRIGRHLASRAGCARQPSGDRASRGGDQVFRIAIGGCDVGDTQILGHRSAVIPHMQDDIARCRNGRCRVTIHIPRQADRRAGQIGGDARHRTIGLIVQRNGAALGPAGRVVQPDRDVRAVAAAGR